jgi:hypothetical protein
MPAQDHIVTDGECISIAFSHGFFWETLWDHGNNADLKSRRKDPNVLQAGDVVHIPDLRLNEESCATEQTHKFKLKGVPAKLKIRVLKKGQPRKNTKYRLIIDGVSRQGTTDSAGFVKESLPPAAREGRLYVGDGADQQVFVLRFGAVDPLDTDEGVAGRLHNLGYSISGDMRGAVTKFQADNGLRATGQVDDATRDKLKEKFGQ